MCTSKYQESIRFVSVLFAQRNMTDYLVSQYSGSCSIRACGLILSCGPSVLSASEAMFCICRAVQINAYWYDSNHLDLCTKHTQLSSSSRHLASSNRHVELEYWQRSHQIPRPVPRRVLVQALRVSLAPSLNPRSQPATLTFTRNCFCRNLMKGRQTQFASSWTTNSNTQPPCCANVL